MKPTTIADTKKCGVCKQIKTLGDYYLKLGEPAYLCKDCDKSRRKKWYDERKNDPTFIESERARMRKSHREGKKKPTISVNKNENLKSHFRKYPEKYAASIALYHVEVRSGFERHHWSYHPDHHTDILYLTKREHSKAHRFLNYDQTEMRYRRIDNNELLSSKEAHLEYINHCISNQPD